MQANINTKHAKSVQYKYIDKVTNYMFNFRLVRVRVRVRIRARVGVG
jgi:hypothetical protein